FNILQIEPIRELEHQCAIFTAERCGKIVFGIYKEQVGCRTVSPLEAHVQVHVIQQIVVLDIRGYKKFVRESKIDSWAREEELFLSIVIRQLKIIIVELERYVSVWLVTVV